MYARFLTRLFPVASASRKSRSVSRRRQPRTRQPRLEELEPRQMLATYYVDASGGDGGTTGNNNNNGTGPTSAWLTLARAFDTSQTNYVHRSDTLIMRGGIYTESVLDTIPDGTQAAPTTITTYQSEKATFKPNSNFGIRIWDTTSQYIKFIGNDPNTPKLVFDGADMPVASGPIILGSSAESVGRNG